MYTNKYFPSPRSRTRPALGTYTIIDTRCAVVFEKTRTLTGDGHKHRSGAVEVAVTVAMTTTTTMEVVVAVVVVVAVMVVVLVVVLVVVEVVAVAVVVVTGGRRAGTSIPLQQGPRVDDDGGDCVAAAAAADVDDDDIGCYDDAGSDGDWRTRQTPPISWGSTAGRRSADAICAVMFSYVVRTATTVAAAVRWFGATSSDHPVPPLSEHRRPYYPHRHQHYQHFLRFHRRRRRHHSHRSRCRRHRRHRCRY